MNNDKKLKILKKRLEKKRENFKEIYSNKN